MTKRASERARLVDATRRGRGVATDEPCEIRSGWNSGTQYYRQNILSVFTRYEISPCLAVNEPARGASQCDPRAVDAMD